MVRTQSTSTEETREQILDTAEALFLRVGYAKTTVADIAQALGMSSANVYRYFPSKSAINDAGCRRLMARLRGEMRAIAAGPGSAAERIAAVVLSTHRRNRELLTAERRVHDMVEAAMAESWEAIEEHKAACNMIFADLIRAGIGAGEFAALDAAALDAAALDAVTTVAETVGHACCILFHPTMIAQCARPQNGVHGGSPDETSAHRLIWLVLEALRNPARRPLP